jgi:CRP/FNR family cyclic AMP-dependent transcriptional regulator
LPAPRPPAMATTLIRVLDDDPGLADALDPARLLLARRSAVAPLVHVPRGAWQPPADEHSSHRDLGMLILSGLLARDQQVAGRTFTELRGPEDLLRPWDDATEATSVAGRISWTALRPTRLAWLDGEFAAAVARWPEITSALLGRAVRRARLLSFRTALLELKHVDLRVLLLLWHLADRWGNVRADGVYVDLPLTHDMIARMVGAHRTTVTIAVARLNDQGRLERTGRGGWLLLGGAPNELSDVDVPARSRG